MPWARRCGSATREWWNLETRDRGSWDLRMRARCGVRTTTCRRMNLPRKRIGFWNNVYSLMDSPKPAQSYDLTKILQERKTDAKGMVHYGEAFFTSLGFSPLPKTFWERSLLTKPADRDVVCHASAWDIDSKEDVRIKMCIQITEEDFRVIHHELGHNFYQRAYSPQPPLFQNSANDGFHEAVGDTIALSVTPEYLKKIGLIEVVPPASGDIDYLLQQA